MTQQPPTPPMGERRRRRDAERKAAQATGEHELNQPMTRRERRALEEALASGALELTPDGQYAPTGEVPVTTTGQHVLSGLESGRSAESADSGAQASSADAPDVPDDAPDGAADAPGDAAASTQSPPVADVPQRQSWRDTAQEVEALHPPPTMAKAPDGGGSGDQGTSPGSESAAGSAASARSGGSASSGPSAGSAESAGDLADTGAGEVSRRSLRARQADSGATAPEQPSERTTTGRRPVIRPPASARSTRTVDATGELTSIQRAIRDINAAPEELGTESEFESVAAAEGSPEAADVDAVSAQSPSTASPEPAGSVGAEASSPASPAEAVGRASAEASSPATSASSSFSAEEDDEEEADDSFDMSPRWPSLSAVAAESTTSEVTDPDTVDDGAADRGVVAGTTRATAADANQEGSSPEQARTAAELDSDEPDEAEEEADDERHTPRVLQVLYWLVLVLAGLVLGLLVWRMATGDLFGGDDALALTGTLLPLRQ